MIFPLEDLLDPFSDLKVPVTSSAAVHPELPNPCVVDIPNPLATSEVVTPSSDQVAIQIKPSTSSEPKSSPRPSTSEKAQKRDQTGSNSSTSTRPSESGKVSKSESFRCKLPSGPPLLPIPGQSSLNPSTGSVPSSPHSFSTSPHLTFQFPPVHKSHKVSESEYSESSASTKSASTRSPSVRSVSFRSIINTAEKDSVDVIPSKVQTRELESDQKIYKTEKVTKKSSPVCTKRNSSSVINSKSSQAQDTESKHTKVSHKKPVQASIIVTPPALCAALDKSSDNGGLARAGNRNSWASNTEHQQSLQTAASPVARSSSHRSSSKSGRSTEEDFSREDDHSRRKSPNCFAPHKELEIKQKTLFGAAKDSGFCAKEFTHNVSTCDVYIDENKLTLPLQAATLGSGLKCASATRENSLREIRNTHTTNILPRQKYSGDSLQVCDKSDTTSAKAVASSSDPVQPARKSAPSKLEAVHPIKKSVPEAAVQQPARKSVQSVPTSFEAVVQSVRKSAPASSEPSVRKSTRDASVQKRVTSPGTPADTRRNLDTPRQVSNLDTRIGSLDTRVTEPPPRVRSLDSRLPSSPRHFCAPDMAFALSEHGVRQLSHPALSEPLKSHNNVTFKLLKTGQFIDIDV